MIIKIYGEEIKCGAVIKRADKIIVLDENGSVIREDSGITNFDGYALIEGQWTVEDEVPTTEDQIAELENAMCEMDAINQEEISALQETTSALEDALCEMEAANEERMAAIEDALCEMDAG